LNALRRRVEESQATARNGLHGGQSGKKIAYLSDTFAASWTEIEDFRQGQIAGNEK